MIEETAEEVIEETAEGVASKAAMPNQTATTRLKKIFGEGVEECLDCSEYADDFFAEVGDGTILRLEPEWPGLNLQISEPSGTEFYVYHDVYVRDGYVFDPFTSGTPVPLDDYLSTVRASNPGVRVTPRDYGAN